MWWTGIEAVDDIWPFTRGYAQYLPETHRDKASTWLAILTDIFGYEEGNLPDKLQFAMNGIALCEWLHGFEAASGNGFNGFEANELFEELGINDFYLGFWAGQYFFDEILNEADVDDSSEIRAFVLYLIAEKKRLTIRDKLSSFFGDDVALLWALHTSIWPNFKEPSSVLCNDLVNPNTMTDIMETMDSWLFVTESWIDGADN